MQHSFSFVFAAFAFSALAGLEISSQPARVGLGHNRMMRRNPAPQFDGGFAASGSYSMVQQMSTVTTQMSQFTSVQTTSVSMTQIYQQFQVCTQVIQSHVSQFTSITSSSGFSAVAVQYESCVTQFLRVLFQFFQYIERTVSFSSFCQQYSQQWYAFQQVFQAYTTQCSTHQVHLDRCAKAAGVDPGLLKQFGLDHILGSVVGLVEGVGHAVEGVVKPAVNAVSGIVGGLLSGNGN